MDKAEKMQIVFFYHVFYFQLIYEILQELE